MTPEGHPRGESFKVLDSRKQLGNYVGFLVLLRSGLEISDFPKVIRPMFALRGRRSGHPKPASLMVHLACGSRLGL
jgi:hypothetical protein